MTTAIRRASAVHTADSAWDTWSPSDSEPWDIRRVVHLHRRAGFAATGNEIIRDLEDGPAKAIQRLLEGRAYECGVPENFDKLDQSIRTNAMGSRSSDYLQAWWLFRMICSPDPLGERLALMWHHHFATSQAKVRDAVLMYQQNQLFRELGRGHFGELFAQVLRDPAIMIYLDAGQNQASHPNENLGREMMELFSMGVGTFSEADVKNAARSLTGWTVKDRKFRFEPKHHDANEKKLLGHRGNYRGNDVLRIVLEHPATSRRITWRACQLLMGENVVSEAALETLAMRFRNQDMNISWLVETILRSKLFFDGDNIGNRVRSATEFVVGTIRSIGAHTPRPVTLGLAQWTTRMGQRLFHPPNVFGFPEGRNWISSQWMIARTRFVQQLLAGKLHRQNIDIETALQTSIGEEPIADPKLLASIVVGAEPEDLQDVIDSSTNDPHEVLFQLLTSPWAHLG